MDATTAEDSFLHVSKIVLKILHGHRIVRFISNLGLLTFLSDRDGIENLDNQSVDPTEAVEDNVLVNDEFCSNDEFLFQTSDK